MEENKTVKVNNKFGGGCDLGLLWLAGWLFTIGYLKLSFWPGALALIIWPYNLGVYFAG